MRGQAWKHHIGDPLCSRSGMPFLILFVTVHVTAQHHSERSARSARFLVAGLGLHAAGRAQRASERECETLPWVI